MITLKAEFEYVLRIKTLVETKTAPKAQLLTMVFDTGAGTTAIDRKIALDAGYKITKGCDYVAGIGGSKRADYTIIPNLILAGISLGPVYTYVLDFHEDALLRTSAILGMNVLSWFKITQTCHWNPALIRYDTATLLLEPQFDINERLDAETFRPLERGQRFGTTFYMDRSMDNAN